MVIFMLAECSLCGTRYAIAPDVTTPGRWLMFERTQQTGEISHLCVGGWMCLNGHVLTVQADEAVLTSEGQWLVLTVSHPEPVLN